MTLAILCPGQGGQHPDMFDLVAECPEAEAVLSLARQVLPVPPLELVTDPALMFTNRIAQPLVCTAILARWQAIKTRLPTPGLVLGYSVGELAAHAIAGTMTVERCLQLAGRRAELMDAASPAEAGLTAVLGLSRDHLTALAAAPRTAIAIVNGARHFVVGGTVTDLEALEQEAEALGASIRRINVTVPAHTPWLTRAAEAFTEQLAGSELASPRLPILAGIDSRVVRDAAGAAATLGAQVAGTVQWQQCLTEAVERGATVLLELGPGNALVKMARELYPDCEARSLDEFKSLDGALSWVERVLDKS